MSPHTRNGNRQKATLVLFFMLSSGITAFAHTLSGLVTSEVLGWFAWSFPTLIAGTLAGAHMYRKLGKQDYRRLTFMLILVSGGILLWRALLGT